MLNLVGTIGVFAQERLGGLATVAELILAIGKPGAHLLANAALDSHVRIEPSLEMPVPYMMSNSAERNGAATLFLTTLARTRLPITSSLSLMLSMRRMSIRTEEKNLRARPPSWSRGCRT